jgi:GH25 family lysozyme M1 (1,4-beta-N-acetylmuramidase)
MIIKDPVCYDVSHWKIIPNFKVIVPIPALMLTKATEGVDYVDPTFGEYFTAMRDAGFARGAYHFFRKAQDPLKQAQHFVSTVAQYATSDDILVLDFEEGGETAAQIIVFLGYVNSRFPLNIIMNYSRKNLMDAMPMTQAQRDILTGYPVWVAGYPDNADLFASVPAGYIPDQTKWGPVWLWQYSSHGAVYGIDGSVDCNWIHPTLYRLISGEIAPPNGEQMTTWYKVTASSGLNIRNGPGANYSDIGDLFPGDIIEVIETLGGWHHFKSLWRKDAHISTVDPAAWCAAAYTVATAPPNEPPAPEQVPPDYIMAHWIATGKTTKYVPE